MVNIQVIFVWRRNKIEVS